jgi:hypothetical protein
MGTVVLSLFILINLSFKKHSHSLFLKKADVVSLFLQFASLCRTEYWLFELLVALN